MRLFIYYFNLQIYFPAVTICPDLLPYIPRNVVIKSYGVNKFFIYEKNTLLRYYYEHPEYLQETLDEAKYGFDYVDILKKIGNGSINAQDLGVKMLDMWNKIDNVTEHILSYSTYNLNWTYPLNWTVTS